MDDNFQHFVDVAKRDGMAGASTDDGYIMMFTRQKLQALLLGTMEPYLAISIDSDGVVNTIRMDRNKLQNELDSHPDEPLLLIVYTHQPLKN